METTEKQLAVVKDSGHLKGIWRLNYTLINPNGIAGFGGKMLANYPDAVTGKERILLDPNGQEQAGYHINHTSQDFDPERNPKHRLIIDWLIGSPEVTVPMNQVRIDKRYAEHKLSNNRAKLTNLDHQDLSSLDDEETIDKVVGIIVLDGGPKALGIDKLRFILSRLNLTYYDLKHVSDPTTEKKKLRKKLKDFIRTSLKNAKAVEDVIENLDEAKFVYEIKEMIRLDILQINNGMYMYHGNQIGISFESLMKYFKDNVEFYTELTGKLYSKLKK